MTPLEKAVTLVGGQAALARAIGGKCKQAHIWNWLNRPNAIVPAEACGKIEAATGGKVTRHQLRPDLFDPPRTDHILSMRPETNERMASVARRVVAKKNAKTRRP